MGASGTLRLMFLPASSACMNVPADAPGGLSAIGIRSGTRSLLYTLTHSLPWKVHEHGQDQNDLLFRQNSHRWRRQAADSCSVARAPTWLK